MDSFESSLTRLRRKPLPEEWKSDLVDKALAEARPNETPGETVSTRSISSSLTRIAIGLVAACWMAIVGLQLTMPRIDAVNFQSTASLETEPRALSFPLFADRVASWESLHGETL